MQPARLFVIRRPRAQPGKGMLPSVTNGRSAGARGIDDPVVAAGEIPERAQPANVRKWRAYDGARTGDQIATFADT